MSELNGLLSLGLHCEAARRNKTSIWTTSRGSLWLVALRVVMSQPQVVVKGEEGWVGCHRRGIGDCLPRPAPKRLGRLSGHPRF